MRELRRSKRLSVVTASSAQKQQQTRNDSIGRIEWALRWVSFDKYTLVAVGHVPDGVDRDAGFVADEALRVPGGRIFVGVADLRFVLNLPLREGRFEFVAGHVARAIGWTWDGLTGFDFELPLAEKAGMDDPAVIELDFGVAKMHPSVDPNSVGVAPSVLDDEVEHKSRERARGVSGRGRHGLWADEIGGAPDLWTGFRLYDRHDAVLEPLPMSPVMESWKSFWKHASGPVVLPGPRRQGEIFTDELDPSEISGLGMRTKEESDWQSSERPWMGDKLIRARRHKMAFVSQAGAVQALETWLGRDKRIKWLAQNGLPSWIPKRTPARLRRALSDSITYIIPLITALYGLWMGLLPVVGGAWAVFLAPLNAIAKSMAWIGPWVAPYLSSEAAVGGVKATSSSWMPRLAAQLSVVLGVASAALDAVKVMLEWPLQRFDAVRAGVEELTDGVFSLEEPVRWVLGVLMIVSGAAVLRVYGLEQER